MSQTDTETMPAPLYESSEYPLLDIPFAAVLNGRRYTGEGLSLVEAEASGLVDPGLDGERLYVQLVFDFPGFSMALSPEAQVERLSENRLRLIFTDPTGDHAPQLRQILGDWISGDLTSSGAVIRSSILDAPSNGKSAGKGPGVMRRISRGLGSLMVATLTLALVAVALVLIEARLLTTDIAAPGRVVPAGETMRATADGQISFFNPEAAEGDVLFAIDTVDGETLSIAMPCDCVVTPVIAGEGSTVLAGEPVVSLADESAGLVIEAQLPQSLLFAIQRDGTVVAELPDGRQVEASLPDGYRAPLMDPDGAAVQARLVPVEELPQDAAGQVAALAVPGRALAPFDPVIDAAGEMWGRAAPLRQRLDDAAGEVTEAAISLTN